MSQWNKCAKWAVIPQSTTCSQNYQRHDFSVVDAKNGFWHIQLDTDSSFLTTFGTPWGRYRWTRMPFGISPAPEKFQRRLDNALGGLKGVLPIFYDILIYGVGETKAAAIADHDQPLIALLEWCPSKGIKLNKEKCKFRLPEVTGTCDIRSRDETWSSQTPRG